MRFQVEERKRANYDLPLSSRGALYEGKGQLGCWFGFGVFDKSVTTEDQRMLWCHNCFDYESSNF